MASSSPQDFHDLLLIHDGSPPDEPVPSELLLIPTGNVAAEVNMGEGLREESPRAAEEKFTQGAIKGGEQAEVFSVKIMQGKEAERATSSSIMRFTGSNVDPVRWTGCRMVRDVKRHRGRYKRVLMRGVQAPPPVAIPSKEGAGGSVYKSKEQKLKEIAKRRRRLEKYRSKKEVVLEDQPWLMKVKEEMKSKRFKGVKAGGVSNYASYYIFVQTEGGDIEAYPVKNWFDFKPIQRFTSLTAEEAEEKFEKRNATYNYFSVMTRKRLINGEEGDEDKENCEQYVGGKRKKVEKANECWSDSSDEEGKSKKVSSRLNYMGSDEDGDGEKEVDYMSSCSSDDADGDDGEESWNMDLLSTSTSESDQENE